MWLLFRTRKQDIKHQKEQENKTSEHRKTLQGDQTRPDVLKGTVADNWGRSRSEVKKMLCGDWRQKDNMRTIASTQKFQTYSDLNRGLRGSGFGSHIPLCSHYYLGARKFALTVFWAGAPAPPPDLPFYMGGAGAPRVNGGV